MDGGVVILGAPRSGTTLLRRFLDAHPRIHCPPETNLLRACARFLREEPFAGGLGVGVRSGLAFSGIDERDLVDQLREFAFGILRNLAARAGKPVWAEKTAFDAFYIDEIELLCATGCRFICVWRHGLDVAVSMRELCEKMQMYPSELHQYVRRYEWPLEAFATAWVDISRRLQRFSRDHPERCLSVMYERLVEEPSQELERICTFLDQPTDVGALIMASAAQSTPGLGDWKTYQTHGVSSASVGRWRQLPPDVIARLASCVNGALEESGYEPVPIREVPSAEASRRALQLSLFAAAMKSAG
jgi:hypothetical protein